MGDIELLSSIVDAMKANTINDYLIPGVSSSLLENGKVRVFDQTRHQTENIAPHSHRYDFVAFVLKGQVRNHVWVKEEKDSDRMHVVIQKYLGEPGKYELLHESDSGFRKETSFYGVGDIYGMTSDQIHSIEFERGSKVLFFEGPQISYKSKVLLPVMDGLQATDHAFFRGRTGEPQ